MSDKPKVRKHRPLQHAIRRTLALRLGVAALVISIVAGTGAFFVERARTRDHIVDLGRAAVSRFNNQVLDVFDAPAPDALLLQQRMEAFSSARGAEDKSGSFVYAAIYTQSGEELARLEDRGYEHIEAVEALMAEISHDAASAEKEAYSGRIEGRPARSRHSAHGRQSGCHGRAYRRRFCGFPTPQSARCRHASFGQLRQRLSSSF